MTKLPPVEKFPLAVRKNIRDKWDSQKDQFAKDLSELLGTEWAIEVDLPQVFAYAESGTWSYDSFGSSVAEHVRGGIGRLRDFIERYDAETVNEINTICHAHILTLDVDEESRFDCGGADVLDGKLRILFAPEKLNSNIGDAFKEERLLKAFNDAPPPAGDEKPLSFITRLFKRIKYDAKIEEIRTQIGEALNKPDIKLTPNFEDTYAKLKVESQAKDNRLDQKHWEEHIPDWTFRYFKGFLGSIKWQHFDTDDMLQEGFNEAVDKGEIAFRIVDTTKSGTSEFAIEDGVFYLQVTARNWGSNIDDAARGIVDKL
ncbi:Uncharacterized protein SAPIO_CDS6373 [Scedosporium apiospermum]|uniref:Uncharacterized protein n=1 Tax=Pseudallescheria apiosperma TaxID=563466 RepID=A0A084G467_PSEDA|nr:Uncharacterized protein SAPIO_CDS6373 [Scedosporium apiospermum]KEZ42129.1 Uncharacterized protein SAPIO_CDS6373 [Scedosporium apiospermum]